MELRDPRIPLNQAVLYSRPDGLYFEILNATSVSIDGKDVDSAAVEVGSVIRLGPYEIRLVEDPSGVDVAVTVEMIDPLGDDLDRLREISRTSLTDPSIGRRALSWTVAVIIVGLFLAWPLTDYFLTPDKTVIPDSPIAAAKSKARVWPLAGDLAWVTGEISGAHKFLADKCTTCHQRPFERAADAVCAACHAGIRHHVDPARPEFRSLGQRFCQSCHKEHQGRAHIVLNDQDFCADCHDDLKKQVKNFDLGNVSDFGTEHPEFRPTVVIAPSRGATAKDATRRILLDPAKWPVERSNLSFPHAKHLKAGGVRRPDQPQRQILQCENCHVQSADGAGMQPIEMTKHCARCHLLQFEPTRPERTVTHGDVPRIIMEISEFYNSYALAGAFKAVELPATLRRRPGTPISEPQRLEAVAWAGARARRAVNEVFGKTLCRTCHVVSPPTDATKMEWSIAPVSISERWLPKGLFDHRAHDNTQCTTCHKAQSSNFATDVLLPRIETCQPCHGGENASAQVPSTCVMCHIFHLPDLKHMRPELVKAGIRTR